MLTNQQIIRPDGTQEWYRNGKRHRIDGPAIIRPDGHREWYQNHKYHREDGPAVIWPDGSDKYWLDDTPYENKYKWGLVILKMRRKETK